MGIYVYYSKGNGSHASTDDVALIRAHTLKQAEKILSQVVILDRLNHYELYRLRWPKRGYFKRLYFISDY
mgnify:CR=1 FL=1